MWSTRACLVFVAFPWLGACGFGLFDLDDSKHAAVKYDGDAGTLELPSALNVLTYNVAGLPQEISRASPERNIPFISPLLNAYNLVLVQEDFAYHDALTSRIMHPFRTVPNRSSQDLGDGLTLLSWLLFEHFAREPWNDCYGVVDSGSDCLTRKGFSQSRVDFGDGAELYVFNVHMDAGHNPGDLRARAANFAQLTAAIKALPPSTALIVAGDFNERYRDGSRNYARLVEATGLRDAWVEFTFGGVMPAASELSVACGSDPDDPGCERIDKVFFRGGDVFALTLLDYRVEGARFVHPDGAQLSDHRPVAADFELSRYSQAQMASP